MRKLIKPTAIVFHDAGAANLIISWLKNNNAFQIRAYMTGPAKILWHNTFPNIPLYDSLEDALEGSLSLISGTGWSSTIEHQARQLAHAKGIWSIAVIDHWINYRERFIRNGQTQWPNEVWVSDSYALDLAKEAFPYLPIHQFENHYLISQLANIKPAPNDGTILVVLEPVRNTWGREREGEFQALDYFFDCYKHIWPDIRQVLLRQHPSEFAGKYQPWISSHSQVRLDCSIDLADAISKADLVVGVESYALTIALASGRPVYSNLPPWAPPLRLPHNGIQEIRLIS